MSGIIGVTFPVPKHLMPRFFEDKKTVFIKPATVFRELHGGMKFVFYQSHEDTGYVGEATIKRILIGDDPLAFFETFGDAIFLTKEETRAYAGSQDRWQGVRVRKDGAKKKAWIAIELEDIHPYAEVRKPTRFVPVSGRYLRE